MPTRPALFDAPSDDVIAGALTWRLRTRVRTASDRVATELLADTVFHERQRLLTDDTPDAYAVLVEDAARALANGGRDRVDAALAALASAYAAEIHNPFSPLTYRFATRVLPGALTRLFAASRGRDLLFGDFDPASRIHVEGPLARLRQMADESTLILAPTHVSNLDSPLIGYALYAAGLPPFAYGAGFNLFSNPLMAFFMERLGAYTVDRRKRNRLYKDVLKDYSVELLRRRCHSLFFPGGTRSRSGRLENGLKKGLLGTGLAAWQENLSERRSAGDVFIVPCTLSIGLVLEAETLIADALAEEGKQRYIISDDEFSEPRTVATFVRQLLRLDAAVHVVFGEPLDIAGNLVDPDGHSLDPHGRPVDRRGYVTDRAGNVVADEQRDHVYTQRVAERLCDAYRRDLVVQSTHLAALAAWDTLRAAHPSLDTWRLVRLTPRDARVARADVLRRIDVALGRLGPARRAMPTSARAVLEEAIARFGSFHRARAIAVAPGSLGAPPNSAGTDDAALTLDPHLVLYYRNRLEQHGLSA